MNPGDDYDERKPEQPPAELVDTVQEAESIFGDDVSDGVLMDYLDKKGVL